MKYLSLALLVLVSSISYADDLVKDAWLKATLYGSDNDMASLRKVTISQSNEAYTIRIENQFAFECSLTFDDQGNPSALTNCVSTLREGEEGDYSPSPWSASPETIKLKCTTTQKEHLCKGRYQLINGDYKSRSEFVFARKI
ncbi:MAG TPA: hypothetical protein VN030_10080 [Cellvibrio sp.]|nr:hypothetical protein [Cellvibrio sp.]